VAFQSFFRPEGIVLIGATSDPSKLGHGVAENLMTFPGVVHFVGRESGVMLGRSIYASLEQVPDPVDLAVVLVPAHAVPDVLRACGRRGVRSVVIASGGFRETGHEGAALERTCVEIANRHGIRFLGPNCIGVIDTHVPLDTTFLGPSRAPEGSVGFLSHSGALCAAVIDWSRGEGFGFSRLVSLGNQADLTETDLLPAVAEDAATEVIAMYMEGIGDGRGFVDAALGTETPIVVHKAGRFAAGQRAAASHTGALAGDEAAFDAAFRRAGVLRASSTKEMFDWARSLAWLPAMRGPNVAIVTNAGGPGVIAADVVEQAGLSLAKLSEATTAELRILLPPAAGVTNPVDMLASATTEQYAQSLQTVLADDGVDAAMVILPPPPRQRAEDIADALASLNYTKPLVVALMGGPAIGMAADRLRAARIPDYRFPTEAAGALGALYRRSTFRRHTLCVSPADGGGAPIAGEGWLGQVAALALIEDSGIPSVSTVGAADAGEAVRAAASLEYPIAMKAEAPGLIHKSEAGGVILGLENPTDVRRAFHLLSERHKGLLGVVVQPMVSGDQELVVGVIRDPQFGPLLMFGSGGVGVEGLKDVAFALAPITYEDIEYLLSETVAGRNLPEAAVREVEGVLVRLGALAADHPEIVEMEINPLVVRSLGEVRALDARVRVGQSTGQEPDTSIEG
jgi:acetyltransferase